MTASIDAGKTTDDAGNGNAASTSTDNSVTYQPATGNTAPTVVIDSPTFGSVYAKGAATINPLTLQAHFSDPDNGGWTWSVNWDDSTGACPTANANTCPTSTGTVSGTSTTSSAFPATHTFTMAGVYTINVKVCDSAAPTRGCGVQSVWIVIYDPNGGFITGGGWLNVDSQSYCDPTVCGTTQTGRANFGFNSQYKKGATVPTGETEFNFTDGKMDFHSTVYSWLVVSGYKAQYKGTGTINGSGSYDFTLTAYDGDLMNPSSGPDKLRIRITNHANGNVVFDNRYKDAGNNFEPTDMDSADPETIAGGSIVIHKA